VAAERRESIGNNEGIHMSSSSISFAAKLLFAYPGFYQSIQGHIATIDPHDDQSNCVEMQTTYKTESL
jgi:hypothetical protein